MVLGWKESNCEYMEHDFHVEVGLGLASYTQVMEQKNQILYLSTRLTLLQLLPLFLWNLKPLLGVAMDHISHKHPLILLYSEIQQSVIIINMESSH